MNARDFHDEIVEPTLREFDAEFGDRRRAFLAVAVMDSLVAHIYAEANQENIDPFEFFIGRYVRQTRASNGKVIEQDIDLTEVDDVGDPSIAFTTAVSSNQRNDLYFRELIAAECDAFRIIRDLEKANKHAKLVRGKPLVSSSDQVISKPKGYGRGRYGRERFGGIPQMVIQLDSFITDPKTGKERADEVSFEHVLREAYVAVTGLLRLLDERLGRESREYNWHVANEQEE
jgi:hypothetical protein